MLNLTQQQLHDVIERQAYLEKVSDPSYDAFSQGITLSEWWHKNLWVYLGLANKEQEVQNEEDKNPSNL